jgi:Zn finger protein HypA/HybF involved in hydrogenase expression
LNEHLPVYHKRCISKRKGTVAEPLSLFLVATEAPDQKGFFRLEPQSLRCPCCKTDEAVIGALEDGNSCPKCRSGTIIDEGFIEY